MYYRDPESGVISEKFTFAIVEDHPLVVASLCNLAKELYPNATCVAFDSTEMLLRYIRSYPVDFVFLDLMLKTSLAINGIADIKKFNPEVKILVISSFEDELYAAKTLAMGVDGYVNKREPNEIVQQAVRTIMAGNIHFKKDILKSSEVSSNRKEGKSPFEKLGNRELEIALLLIEGFSITYVAEILNLSRSTVSSHKMHILEKLGLNNIMQLKDLADSYKIKSK